MLKLLLSIQMICVMFTKILMNTILIKKIILLIVFDDMIAKMIHKKKLSSIVTELFIRGSKLNIPLVFIHNHIFRFQKMLDEILATFFSQKFRIKENSNKLQ